ncbi:MAG: preprotein translocase subunit SecG [Clostridia bacterium]|nr:preprotein translocase subunit SecG [Clostridia bacterium]
MSVLFIIICILIAITSFALIALILMQKKQAAGFTSAMGGGMGSSSTQTYWDKNKKNSLEGKLEFYTKVVAAVYVLLILISNFVK